MTFEAMIDQILALLKRQGRVSYSALRRRFGIDAVYLDDLKDELLYAQPQIADDDGRGLIWTGDLAMPDVSARLRTEAELLFHALLPAVTAFLQREGRVTYRTLKFTFALNDVLLEEMRQELVFKRLAFDEGGEGLVWAGKAPVGEQPGEMVPSQHHTAAIEDAAAVLSSAAEAERRQLTVMFCDLVGSTDLAGKLDPEDLREVVRAYQEAAAVVIERYEGHIAQYLGDGLLIYFGFPVAHEDDAQRAVHTGLGIPEAIAALNARLQVDYGVQLAVRIGIHTGPVVVGAMGGGSRHENLALGETPNIAARLEGLAPANTVIISSATAQLAQRSFILEELGPHTLKGVAEAVTLFRVVGPRASDQADDSAMGRDFDDLFGRDEEIGLLLRRWQQSREGLGQVVLLCGEAGIGKSSLVEGLRRHVRQAGGARIAFRCSPYHANSAFYPIIDHVQRALDWQSDDTADVKLSKLEQGLARANVVQEDAAPLLAGLLGVPLPTDRYAPLSTSLQQQRQQTQDVLVAWLLEEAERQPVLAVWEDLHWADPSTLETLGLFVDQAPTVSMLHVLTYRPVFEPPWPARSHLTPMALNRLERPQVEALIGRLAGGKALPTEMVEHIVDKTDGVPLYVEELTKMLLESELLREESDRYVLTGSLSTVVIPDTLQDSLMARLDQLGAAKETAQLGAVLGREFGYEMLQAISTQDDATLQEGLAQLVAAELLYQRGRPPKARYIFKHALIQDAAYESLLRGARQQAHWQIVQVLETRFPELVDTQPELAAHHCTAAGRDEAAIRYWRQAGQRARQRSAYVEAISHSRQGLLLLGHLPESTERDMRELDFQLMLGSLFMTNKGPGTSEVVEAFERARELCHQLGDAGQLVPVLRGLWNIYTAQGLLTIGLEFAEEALRVAEREAHPMSLIAAHRMLATSLLMLGKFVEARHHLDNVAARYDRNCHDAYIAQLGGAGTDPCVGALALLQLVLWFLGYPDQARQISVEGLDLSSKLSHPYSRGYALWTASLLYCLCREPRTAHEYAASAIEVSSIYDFPQWEMRSRVVHGWALAEQGQSETGLNQIEQTMEKRQGPVANLSAEYVLQAAIFFKKGDVTRALCTLAAWQERADIGGGDWFEAEGVRLKGECLLMLSMDQQDEAESCFRQALDIARSQHAKSWELRAATSLARLWRRQGKDTEAHDVLTPIYAWFTEGFDTADLKDAKSLLDELA